MKKEHEIDSMIAELETSNVPLDIFMQGYLSALKWVTKKNEEADV